MQQFLDSLYNLFGEDNYFTFFENPDVDGSGPWMVSDIVFGFTFMKLLDSALRHSKENILNVYEKNKESQNLENILMDAATYPTGETLGFYNTSEYDFDKLSECEIDLNSKIRDYVEGFSDNVKIILEKLPLSDVLKFLNNVNKTYEVFATFHKNQIAGDYYSSYDRFTAIFSDFIKCIWRDEIYSMRRTPIVTYNLFSSYHYIHEALKEYGTFLNTLLLTDEDFNNNDRVKIYDPDSSGAYILEETDAMILRELRHKNLKVELYGKSKKVENEIIYLTKKLVSKKDPYEIEGTIILDVNEDLFSIDGIASYDDFNYIVSNYLYNNLTEYKEILELFKKNHNGNTKLVIALNDLDDFSDCLDEMIKQDNLESIISFKNHYILIANLNKHEGKRGHFLLIDESDPDLDDDEINRENKQAFSNNEYDIFNAPKWKTLTKSDHDKMEAILKSYQNFEDDYNSKLIKNDEYDLNMIKIML